MEDYISCVGTKLCPDTRGIEMAQLTHFQTFTLPTEARRAVLPGISLSRLMRRLSLSLRLARMAENGFTQQMHQDVKALIENERQR